MTKTKDSPRGIGIYSKITEQHTELDEDRIMALYKHLNKLEDMLEIAIKVLKFYGDRKVWRSSCPRSETQTYDIMLPSAISLDDEGHQARMAIALMKLKSI